MTKTLRVMIATALSLAIMASLAAPVAFAAPRPGVPIRSLSAEMAEPHGECYGPVNRFGGRCPNAFMFRLYRSVIQVNENSV